MMNYQLSLKQIIYNLCIVGITAAVTSCNSGDNSNNNSTPVVNSIVQSVSPANGDTEVGVSTPITITFNTPVESTGVLASLINLNSLSPETTVPLAISGSGTIYTFTPESNLLPETQYKFVLIKKVATNKSSLTQKSTQSSSSQEITSFTTQIAYKIFTTSGEYKGNLQGDYANAVAGADALCNADKANPDTTKYYKAMLSATSLRYACNSDDLCGGSYSKDWVLQPRSTYYNVNAESIGNVPSVGVFYFPLELPFGEGDSKNVWTGLTDNWGSTSSGDSCKSWTSSSSSNDGKCGRSGQTGAGSISNDKQACNGTRKLYCVMQPTATLVTPQQGSTTTNLSTSIDVMINVVDGVNSSTVTTSTFTVVESAPEEIGHNISGRIRSSGSTYSFFPDTALVSGKTYTITLSSGITNTKGVAIQPGTLSFYTAGITKLMYTTSDQWWGDLLEAANKAGSSANNGISGADYLCQSDPQCPIGVTCKAIISDNKTRVACVDVDDSDDKVSAACGPTYAKDWVISPNTTYVNTTGVVLGVSNNEGIFNFSQGFQFDALIGGTGKNWTGLTSAWTSNKDAICDAWTKGDSGVNQLGGLLGYTQEINSKSIGANKAGGCSQYNYEDIDGKHCNSDELDGCSKRGLYCVVQ